ncbi:MAG: hypothetical protein K9N06_12435 [Candidatus Cloacimonetes bacterium]|nr:hypothetical protein [Candidatus Cloacimonadota bacterium]
MKTTLRNPYRTVTGRDGDKVAFGWKDLEVTFLRNYFIPDNPVGQAAFAAKATHIITTYKDADSNFLDDLQAYVYAWNDTQLDGRTQIPRNRTNIFTKACFAAAKTASFDLSTLTAGNFGGEVGDLLGTAAPNIGNLVIAAGLPSCGLDLATLNNPIIAA